MLEFNMFSPKTLQDRFNDVLRHLAKSNDLAAEACKQAACALSALEVEPKAKRFWDKLDKELLKTANRAVRNVMIWRIHGFTLGVDSHSLTREMFGRYGQLVDPSSTVSQLANGWRNMFALITGRYTFDAVMPALGPSLLAPLKDPEHIHLGTPRRRSTSRFGPVTQPNLDDESDSEAIAQAIVHALEKLKKEKHNERPQAAPRTPRNQAGNQAGNRATARGRVGKPKGQQGRGFALFQEQQQLPAPAERRFFQHAAH